MAHKVEWDKIIAEPEIKCECIDKSTKTILLIGIDEVSKRLEEKKRMLLDVGVLVTFIKMAEDNIRDVEKVRDEILRLKEC